MMVLYMQRRIKGKWSLNGDLSDWVGTCMMRVSCTPYDHWGVVRILVSLKDF